MRGTILRALGGLRMPLSIFRLDGLWLAVALAIALGAGTGLAAQEDDATGRQRVELSELDTFLKNKDGTLIQYFNITFEEFERVYNALNARANAESSTPYSIRTANIVTRVRGQTADLAIELRVLTETDAEIEVPLEMDQAVFPLAESFLVRRDGKYFVRVQGQNEETVTVKLNAIQPIERVRGLKQLQLNLPSATFTTVQIHDLESDLVFSADQSSISRPVEPLFANGSAYEFAGLKDAAVISWSRRDQQGVGVVGTIESDLTVTATVEPERIRYEANFTIRSDEPISSLKIGLPKQTTEVDLEPATGMILSREPEDDVWKIHQIDFSRQDTVFEDISLKWTVAKSGSDLNLVGFEIFGFQFSQGTLTVRSEDEVSFVLANRFNLDDQERISPNRQYSYALATSIFSATAFTIVESAQSQKRVDLNLKLGSEGSTLELQLPADLMPDNPDAVTVALNGWTLKPGQENLTVDPLLRQVEVSPVFFLNDDPTRRMQFTLDSGQLGEREVRFPEIRNLGVDRFRYSISCTDDIRARFDRDKNPTLVLNSQFEREIIAAGKSLSVTSVGKDASRLRLTLEPVLPLVEGNQDLKLRESRGRFFLDSQATLRSSRAFDSLAAIFPASVGALTIDGVPFDLSAVPTGEPHLLKLANPVTSVVLESRFDLGTWSDDSDLDVELIEFMLPVSTGFNDPQQQLTEIQGRNYSKVSLRSSLSVATSSGIRVLPDQAWTARHSASGEPEKSFAAQEADTIRFSRTKLTDEDIHVEQVWCHTRLNNEFRQDRVVIRFVPKRSVVNWTVPEGTRLVNCRLDGKSLNVTRRSDETPIRTDFEDLQREHVIEFELRFFHSSFENRLHVRLPKTSRLLWCQSMYWSVHLPDSHYVLNYSNGLSANYVLDWNGFFLRPMPKRTVRDLERWVGTVRGSTIDLEGNDYLFSSFGMVDDRSVLMISKSNLVLIFGLAFITLGCAFVSLSFMRHAYLLVAIAAGILILGMWYPIWFVQLLQIEIFVAFLFGVGFVISRLTNWLSPTRDETRIETNVPSLVLAAPDSGIEQSAETRGLSGEGVRGKS